MIASDRVPTANVREVTVDGTSIHYLESGTSAPTDEPPVVLLHGSGIDDAALSWKHAIPFLVEGHRRRVFALDWPGYGESDQPSGATTTAYYVDVLGAFLDAVGVETATLVGISMGGSAALGYTLDRPERVERLVLVDSYGLRDSVPGGTGSYLLANTPFANLFGRQFAAASDASTRVAIGEFVHDADSLPDEFVADVRERLRTPGAGRAFFSFMREEFRPDGVVTDYSDRFDDLTVPTLLVHGREDPLVPAEWSRDAAAAIPNASLSILDECGHWPPRECPTAFNERLGSFV